MRFAAFAFAFSLVALGLSSRSAHAATSTASIGVTATVQSACQASTPVTAFGSYVTSPVSVSCTVLTPYNVTLSAGTTADAATETSSSGKLLLNNMLLSSSMRSTIHTRASGKGALAGTGSGPSLTPAAYSQTAQARYVSAGAFADAITVTVTY
jgi:spore coat protein U-like protein